MDAPRDNVAPGDRAALESPSELNDPEFLELLIRSGVELRAVQGQLRISAPNGFLNDTLKSELRRRKPDLLTLLESQSHIPTDVYTTPWTTQMAFWRSRLAGASFLLELPFSQQRTVLSSAPPSSFAVPIVPPLNQALQRLAEQQGMPLNTILLAAYAALLHRYTGQDDFCLGVPLPLSQTFILRLQPQPAWPFTDFLQHVHATVIEAHAHVGLPFAELVEELQPESDPSTPPLVQILFSSDPFGSTPSSPVVAPAPLAFDISLRFEIAADQSLSAVFDYRAGLFSTNSIAQFATSFTTILEAIVRDSNRPALTLANLDILSEAQLHQILIEWNQTDLDFPRDASIHSLFEQQAEQSPHAIAVVCADQSISYTDLNRRANQLAHLLLQRGLVSQQCVGICVSRSISMIVAMLAALKAGGAYLPLDPTYPPQRLQAMLDDSGTTIVLTEDAIIRTIPLRVAHLLRIDTDSSQLALLPDSNPAIPVPSNYLAYVIYTSGSTGRPKGVAIEHHSAVSLLIWARQLFTPAELERTLAATSISFDLSVFEIFLPLLAGATVLLVENVLQLAQAGSSLAPTLINTVPSALAALLATCTLPGSVLCVNLAGEPFPEPLVQLIESQAPQARIFDLYGPTETTTYSTFARRHAAQPATIGRPLANTRIFLLDANLQPVPPGIPGQIFIAGEGVARGYLHQPELTAQRFVSLDHLPGASRAYQTGDLARYSPDGNIQYLGRIDHQVKIRGFRIELGEIETTLRRHPQVVDAIVVVRSDEALGNTLAAFVIASPSAAPIAQLIALQRESLPAHMVVSDIAILDRFPLTPNGKLDRTTLSQRAPTMLDLAASSSETTTDTEEQLTLIWEKQFERSPIGLDEDFFDIGGHSLLAFQIFSEIEQRMHTPLMLAVLLKAPTLRQLAREIDRTRSKPN
jgi:amino acid adenylation domain-containing protein